MPQGYLVQGKRSGIPRNVRANAKEPRAKILPKRGTERHADVFVKRRYADTVSWTQSRAAVVEGITSFKSSFWRTERYFPVIVPSLFQGSG